MLTCLDFLREMSYFSVLFRLLLSMLLGGMIGLERARKRRAAGFRTYMLVCMGSALTSILSQYFTVMMGTVWAAKAAGQTIDVSRLGSMVYNGIGFLSAGTIIVTGHQEVKGLTTAAGLWAAACMGVAIGAGFYECVGIAFVLIFLSMRILRPLEAYLVEHSSNMNLYVEIKSLGDVGALIALVKGLGVQIYDIEVDCGDKTTQRNSVILTMRLNHNHHTQIIAEISDLEAVTKVDEI